MKMLLFLLNLFFLTNSFASEQSVDRSNLAPPEIIFDVQELNRTFFSEMKNQTNNLKKVKYYLLNGNTHLARAHLMKLTYHESKLRPIIFRYLAWISFVEGDFEKIYQYLSIPELNTYPHFGKVCLLKTMTEVALNKIFDLEKNWDRCRIENGGKFSEKNVIWAEILVQLKLKNDQTIRSKPFKNIKLAMLENPDTKTLLKLAIYLNQEHLFYDEIPQMTYSQLKDEEIQEIVGHIYFKGGQFKRSYQLIKELPTPNSHTIKGNLHLLLDQKKQAYEEFKKALEIKQNSLNAMERVLPQAWLLGDSATGIKYSRLVFASPETHINKLTLLSAFLIQDKKYQQAQEVLNRITQNSKKGLEVEVNQLISFNSLMINKSEVAREKAQKSCQKNDLINCWMLYQLTQWDKFPLVLKREDEIPLREKWQELTKQKINDPIKEKVYINQMDIEELDDQAVNLLN